MSHAFQRATRTVLAALIAILAIPASAGALGPGGWDNLGERAGMTGFAALDGRVDVMSTELPGKLLAGGAFTAAGVPAGNTADDDHIAVWDGASWSPLAAGAGLNGDVHALEVVGSKVYAGGVFTNAGGNANNDFLAVWDTAAPGAGWQSPCGPAAIAGSVDALVTIGNTLYVGGAFQNGAGIPSADYLLACDLTTGTPSSTFAVDGDGTGSLKALVADANGDLYVGGNFINYDQIPAADYVAKYDLPAGTWSAMGPSAIDTTGVDSLATIGNDVYVGSDDVDIAGLPQADHIAKWDGAAWSAVGSNTGATNGYLPTGGDVQALTTSGSNIYASGLWQNADGDPLADSIARFDGVKWDHVGSNGAVTNGPLGGNLNRGLAVFDGNLIAGGNFADAGGDPLADSIACFKIGASPCLPQPPSPAPPSPATPSATQPLPANGFSVASRASCAAPCNAIQVKVTFDSAGSVIAEQAPQGQAAARAAASSKKKAKPPLIKKLTTAVSAGANTLKLKLTAAGKKKLAEQGSVRVKVQFTFTPTGGTAKSEVEALSVKLPKKKG